MNPGFALAKKIQERIRKEAPDLKSLLELQERNRQLYELYRDIDLIISEFAFSGLKELKLSNK